MRIIFPKSKYNFKLESQQIYMYYTQLQKKRTTYTYSL